MKKMLYILIFALILVNLSFSQSVVIDYPQNNSLFYDRNITVRYKIELLDDCKLIVNNLDLNETFEKTLDVNATETDVFAKYGKNSLKIDCLTVSSNEVYINVDNKSFDKIYFYYITLGLLIVSATIFGILFLHSKHSIIGWLLFITSISAFLQMFFLASKNDFYLITNREFFDAINANIINFTIYPLAIVLVAYFIFISLMALYNFFVEK